MTQVEERKCPCGAVWESTRFASRDLVRNCPACQPSLWSVTIGLTGIKPLRFEQRFTKQGVRDLDHLSGRSKGRRLSVPPKHQGEILCRHRNRYEVMDGYYEKCVDCGHYSEVNWP